MQIPFRLRILFWSVMRRTQNSPVTRWLWQYWQHEETGNVTITWFWQNPGRRWQRCPWQD